MLTLGDIVQLTARAAGLSRVVLALPRPLSRLQAAIMDFVPGRPFSTDNYRSTLVDSTCTENGFAALGIEPVSLRAMIRRSLQ